MKRSMMVAMLALLAAPMLALAGSQSPQWSMVVTGTITVGPRGHVAGYALDQPSKLPASVGKLAAKAIPFWLFKPIVVDGKPASAKAGMSLRIVIEKTADGNATVHIAGAAFGCDARRKLKLPGTCEPGTTVRYEGKRALPRYPAAARRGHASGDVFLVLEIGRDGHVAKAAVRTVNLTARGGKSASKKYRHILARASLKAARRWRFAIPTIGPAATRDHWIVTVPVTYRLASWGTRPPTEEYGQWHVYFPGPVHDISWAKQDPGSAERGSGDAIAGTAPFLRDPRFVLKTALGADNSHS